MTKYPIKHTMEFGKKSECQSECGMRMKYPVSCKQHNCEHLKVSVTFDLVKDCPECNGYGWVIKDQYKQTAEDCPYCSDNGLPVGKVQRYWTPEEVGNEIGPKLGGCSLDGNTPCYVLINNKWECHGLITHLLHGFPCVIAIFGQPAPPADYRPEEKE